MKDGKGALQLPPGQQDDAEKKLAEQATAALSAVRRGWKHLLLPQGADPNGPNAARGYDFDLLSQRRARAAAAGRLEEMRGGRADLFGLEVARPRAGEGLAGGQPHVALRQLRDWFAQFPYLIKLREPSVLARAIGDAVARSDAKFALADRFDEAKDEYSGLKMGRLLEVDLNSEALLERRMVSLNRLGIPFGLGL